MSTAVSQQGDLLGGRPALVVGGGRMGLAIAHIFAGMGIDTRVVEPDADARDAASGRLRDLSRVRSMDEAIADKVTLFSSIADASAGVAIVIEAAPENLELKQAIFGELEQRCPVDAILATNTSVIPVTQIAGNVRDASRVVGTHFWNPPYAVRLVEVVQAARTSDETIARTMAIMDEIGQLPVHVRKDIPGFIGNRLQHALKREAIALVENGVCDAETVDFVVRNSFGARLGIMGPLEQSDMVGLNLTLAIHEVVLRDLDTSSEPQQLLRELVESGQTGVAVGSGFRRWSVEEGSELRQRLDTALLRERETVAEAPNAPVLEVAADEHGR